MKNEGYSLNDYKNISMKFRDKASNLLKADSENADIEIKRFKYFIDNTPLLKEIVNQNIYKSKYNYKKNFFVKSNGGWTHLNIPVVEEDHIKAIYDYIGELCNLKEINLISGSFGLYCTATTNNYDERIRIFLKKIFEPLIDLIIRELNERMIYMDKESNSIINNIINNKGSVNTTNNGGTINSTQINNANEIEIDKLIKELKTIINDTQDLKSEDRENLIDDLEVVEEQINSKNPKQLRIKKAFNSIVNFTKFLPEGLAKGSNIFIKLQEFIDKSKNFFENL